MELKDFIKNTLKLENRTIFYDLINSASSSKTIFYQILENFPENKEYDTYKKDCIVKFFQTNTISDEQDIEIIKSVNPLLSKNDIKKIIGNNILYSNIETIFNKKQNASDITKSLIYGLSKIQYHDYDEINKQGEIMLKKIISDNISININTSAGKDFLSILNKRTPTNILSILEKINYNPNNDLYSHELARTIKGELVNNKFSNIDFFNDYIRLKKSNFPFVNDLLNEDAITYAFVKTSSDIQIYGELLIPQKIKQLKELHSLTAPETFFVDWFKENLQNQYEKPQNLFQKPHLAELLISLEKEIFNANIPNEKKPKKITTKI